MHKQYHNDPYLSRAEAVSLTMPDSAPRRLLGREGKSMDGS